MKKITALFLALALCLSLCTVTAFASGWADFNRQGNGTEGNRWQIGVTGSESSVTAYLDGGTLIISGMGAMMDFNNLANRPWDGSRASVTDVAISSGVTTIGSNAFQACDNLENVSIPNTVTSIGGFAFEGWDKVSALTSVTIPDSVTSIGYSAFSKAGLTSVTIPDSVTFIDNLAFRNCSNLTSISLSNSITAVSTRLFSKCTSLESVTFPASVNTIAPYVFEDCGTVLTSITVKATTPPTLETDNYGGKDHDAFDGLTIIPTIYVPAASVGAYQAAAGWSAYADYIKAVTSAATFTKGEHVTGIQYKVNNGAFAEYTASVTNLVQGDKITIKVTCDEGYTYNGTTQFTVGTADINETINASLKPTPHHHSSTTTTPTVTSATTADAGIALYGVLSVSSLLGMGWVAKRKH